MKQPTLRPRDLKPGMHKIGEVPEGGGRFYSFISDDRARWAALKQYSSGQAFVVDGHTAPKAADKVGHVHFSRDGRCYSYDLIGKDWKYLGRVVDGKAERDRGSVAIHYHSYTDNWFSCRYHRDRSVQIHTSLGNYQLPPALLSYMAFTRNGRHFVYSYVPWESFGDGALFVGGKRLHQGDVFEFYVSNRRPYASWRAYDGDADEEYLYLLGKRVATLPADFEIASLSISADHQHYLYAGGDNPEARDKHGLTENLLYYIDGKPQPGRWRGVVQDESYIAEDGVNYYIITRGYDNRCHFIVNGSDVFQADLCTDAIFSDDYRHHACIAYEFNKTEMRKRFHIKELPMKRGYVVLDGRPIETGQSVLPRSMEFSPDNRHFAFISCDIRNGEAGRGNCRVNLNRQVVGHHDIVFGRSTDKWQATAFSRDSRRLYYFAIEGTDLYFVVHEIE